PRQGRVQVHELRVERTGRGIREDKRFESLRLVWREAILDRGGTQVAEFRGWCHDLLSLSIVRVTQSCSVWRIRLSARYVASTVRLALPALRLIDPPSA